MSPDEILIVRALAGCRFAPATSPKRFVRQLEGRATDKPITDKQRAYLWAVAYSWRRQLSPALARLAERYSGGVGVQGRKFTHAAYQAHLAAVAAARAEEMAAECPEALDMRPTENTGQGHLFA